MVDWGFYWVWGPGSLGNIWRTFHIYSPICIRQTSQRSTKYMWIVPMHWKPNIKYVAHFHHYQPIFTLLIRPLLFLNLGKPVANWNTLGNSNGPRWYHWHILADRKFLFPSWWGMSLSTKRETQTHSGAASDESRELGPRAPKWDVWNLEQLIQLDRWYKRARHDATTEYRGFDSELLRQRHSTVQCYLKWQVYSTWKCNPFKHCYTKYADTRLSIITNYSKTSPSVSLG